MGLGITLGANGLLGELGGGGETGTRDGGGDGSGRSRGWQGERIEMTGGAEASLAPPVVKVGVGRILRTLRLVSYNRTTSRIPRRLSNVRTWNDIDVDFRTRYRREKKAMCVTGSHASFLNNSQTLHSAV